MAVVISGDVLCGLMLVVISLWFPLRLGWEELNRLVGQVCGHNTEVHSKSLPHWQVGEELYRREVEGN